MKTCIAGACTLGFVAVGGPVTAADQEDVAVEQDLRPNEEPAIVEDEGMKPKEAMPEASGGGSDGDMENKMIDEIGPGAQ